METMSQEVADTILGLQCLVGWAGEGLCEPTRLGWWETDLVDEFGGGDFFDRLTPETRRWASLDAVREAARRTDDALRQGAADPESIRSLYHFGHEIDADLSDRWSELQCEYDDPADVLDDVSKTREDFERQRFEAWCESRADIEYRSMPAGRQLRGDAPDDPARLAEHLIAALVPFPEEYPMPHYTV
jgi:hypothetical protein